MEISNLITQYDENELCATVLIYLQVIFFQFLCKPSIKRWVKSSEIHIFI